MRMSELERKLEAIADNFNLPSITEWRQGKFIDSPEYSRMSDEWKENQQTTESTLIRPYGGTNNALFKVYNSGQDSNIAEYLEAVGKVLREEL